jgi:MFS family permease
MPWTNVGAVPVVKPPASTVDKSSVHEVLQALRIPGFARLAATFTLNDFAHFLATIALSLLVYDQTGDAAATTALFLAAEFLPGLFVPALASRVDGLRPSRVLGTAYVVEAGLLGGIAVLTGAFWLPLVLVLAFLNGALAATARAVTRSASVALLEPHGALRAGNAALNVGFSVNSAAGPAIAGGLVALVDTGPALAAAAGLFAVLAAFIGSARALPAIDAGEAAWYSRLGEALAHVRSNPSLRRLLMGQGVALALLTMVIPIQVLYAKESLGTSDAGFGVFVAAWGLGMVVGSALFARERTRSVGQLIVVSTAALGFGYLGIAAAPTLGVACAAAVLGGMGNGIQWVSVVTAVQEATTERFQARVAGLLEAIASTAPGIGFVAGGGIATLLSPRASFAVAGAGVLVLLVIGCAVVLRGRRDPAGPAVDAVPEPAAS